MSYDEGYDEGYYDENQVAEYGAEGYEEGYYDENGEWIYYEAEENPKYTMKTDMGEISYEVVEGKGGVQLMVDSQGRLLNYGKLENASACLFCILLFD